MASWSAGRSGGDAKELGWRRLLSAAERDDEARSEALDALVERSMLAVTWPGSAPALRTLRNAGGERALALFSAQDTLEVAAARLGWTADGVAPSRSVQAREALEAALAQGIACFVIDLDAPHALELAADEVALLLAVRQKRAPQAPAAEPAVVRGKPLIDIDLPFVQGRGEGEPAARGGANVPEPGGAARGAAAPASGAGPARVERAPEPAASLIDRAFAASLPEDAAATPPSPAAEQDERKPEPRPAAPQRTVLGHVAAPASANAVLEPPRASAPESTTGAASAARAGAGASEADRASAQKAVQGTEEKASPIKAAKRVFATMLGTGPSEEARGEGQGEDEAGEAHEEPSYAEGALRPLDVGLSEALLGSISETLRGYPEVEWACEVGDGTEVPVLGLRISPSFLTRATDIEAAVQAAAQARGVELRVLLLTDAERMREARVHGAAFYPWRRRK